MLFCAKVAYFLGSNKDSDVLLSAQVGTNFELSAVSYCFLAILGLKNAYFLGNLSWAGTSGTSGTNRFCPSICPNLSQFVPTFVLENINKNKDLD